MVLVRFLRGGKEICGADDPRPCSYEPAAKRALNSDSLAIMI